MLNQNKRIGGFVFFLVLSICILSGIFWALKTRTQRKLHKAITIAYVSDFTIGYRGALVLIFEYTISKKTYKKEQSFSGIYTGDHIHFIKKFYPVVYEVGKVDNSQLLVTPNDFKGYNMSFPDSLNWVLQYIK